MKTLGSLTLALLVLFVSTPPVRGQAGELSEENRIRERLKAYAPVRLDVDLSSLSARQRQALAKIIVAVKAVDTIYWKQMGRQSLEARRAFENSSDPSGRLYRNFIDINYGPFDIRDNNNRFVDVPPGGERWPGAGFYPEDLTRDELESHLEEHPELRDEFERIDTVIRRVDDVLIAIPYERLYLDDLKPAARALQEAALLVDSPSLRRYLSLRAEALPQHTDPALSHAGPLGERCQGRRVP